MMSTVLVSPASVLHECDEYLRSIQNSDGGWGYASGLPTQPEPTALAIIALGYRTENGDVIQKAAKYLAGLQDSSGAIRVPGAFSKNYWPTALAIVALHRMPEYQAVIKKGLGWLLSLQSKTKDMNEELARDFEIDTSLLGWSWTEDTFSWVDPTSWVILALRHTGHADHPRTAEGLKLLLDRAYPEGGANCGNRRIYGSMTEPVPANTCSLLLAHGRLEDHPKLIASRDYVRRSIKDHADLENLCWTRLALEAWKSEPATAKVLPELQERILDLYAEQTNDHRVFKRSTVRQSLTILALSSDTYQPLLPATDEPVIDVDARIKPKRAGIGERLAANFKGMMVAAVGQLRALPDSTTVHIARAGSYDDDLVSIVAQQYETFRAKVPLKDKRVVIKPNLVEYHPDRVINTNPKVIGAVIALCQKEGAKEVIVAEGPGHWRNVEYLVTASGLRDVLARYDVKFIDVNSDRIAQRLNLGMLTGMEHIYYSATVAEADVLISMPKFKTHHWAGVTLSLKNLFGTLPGICYGWPKNELHHRGIENSIIDIALTRTPELAVVDGIIGMEGDGPLNGKARPVGAIIMGNDPLAVDATCARMMGFRAEKIGHLLLGSRRRLGHLESNRIVQAGETIESLRQKFEPPPKLEEIVE
ncbi:MAG: DUF362 domain-containing protein [Gemmatales bacterium]